MKKDEELLKDVFDEMLDTYIKKNHDYGNSVDDTYKKFGLVSFLVRIEDKLNRAHTLSKGEKQLVQDEKLEDTLKDLANYAAIALMTYRKHKNENN